MPKADCWIQSIDYEAADPSLRQVYDAVTGPSGEIENLYKAYGLRAHMIMPADALYRATLHSDQNELPKWLLELVGSYVAHLTGCAYALTHHGHNFKAIQGDPDRAERMLAALSEGASAAVFDDREAAILRYVEKLTRAPGDMREEDVEALRAAGLTDGEILEVNQVAASFHYWVRVINGLGIGLGDEKVGFYD